MHEVSYSKEMEHFGALSVIRVIIPGNDSRWMIDHVNFAINGRDHHSLSLLCNYRRFG